MNTDLTRGKPFKVLLIYILPLFGSAVFQQLYTLADTIIAGKFAGPTALTAIGASNSIVNILMAIALGANAGCAVLVSRLFGAKNNAGVKTAIFTGYVNYSSLIHLKTLLMFKLGAGARGNFGYLLSDSRLPHSVILYRKLGYKLFGVVVCSFHRRHAGVLF